ncbi:MAG: hypothetical protein FJ358_06085 [Thaumarchaeota archaeon]|nr:hypothetical protein [Nitrososphaerota archaeon]
MEDASRQGENCFVVYHEKTTADTFVIPFSKVPPRYWPDRKGYTFNIDKVGGKFIIRQNGVDLAPYFEKYAYYSNKDHETKIVPYPNSLTTAPHIS